jgi:hypothetical protein
MTNPNDFVSPSTHQNSDGTHDFNINKGLTKREYFAAMALQGLCANPILKDVIDKVKSAKEFDSYTANTAVSIADALINALNKQ